MSHADHRDDTASGPSSPGDTHSAAPDDPGQRQPAGGEDLGNDTVLTVVRGYGWRRTSGILLLVLALAALLGGLVAAGADLLLHRQLVPAPWWLMAGVGAVTGFLLAWLGYWLRTTAPTHEVRVQQLTGSAAAFYLAFLIGVAVSADTSYRFFLEKVGIANPVERIAMFSGIEVMLLGAGLAMRRSMVRRGKPGPTRFLAWGLCAMSALAALILAGWPIGPARTVFGPVLAVLALHYALGIELRDREAGEKTQHEAATMLVRIGRELRERFLSRLGLADDQRTALQRTRERAVNRAARLAGELRFLSPDSGKYRRKHERYLKALRASNASRDPEQRARVAAAFAIEQHATSLIGMTMESPWRDLEARPEPDHDPVAQPDQAGPDSGPETPTMPVTAAPAEPVPDLPDHAEAPLPDLPDHIADMPDHVPPMHEQQPANAQVDGWSEDWSRSWSDTPDQVGPMVWPAPPEPVTSAVEQSLGMLDRRSPTIPTTTPTSTPEPWSGTGNAAPKLAPAEDDADHHAGDRPGRGRVDFDTDGDRILVKVRSMRDPEQIADVLAPIAEALAAEDDFLSRADITAITDINSSTTAGQVLKAVQALFPDHPSPTGRRKPDRERTIAAAVAKMTGQAHLKSVR